MHVVPPSGPVASLQALPPANGGAAAVLQAGEQAGRLTFVTHLPGRAGRHADWPSFVPPELIAALAGAGVAAPWEHQAAAAELAAAGQSVIIATGTASGKSLGYLLPALAGVLAGGTALYIAPTRALAADQLKLVRSLRLDRVRAAVVDGDTPWAERTRARSQANYLLTTPDMLHQSLLPGHARWNGFFRRLRFVIVDECHTYRGVFGSHVAHVLRRLRRVAVPPQRRRSGVRARIRHYQRARPVRHAADRAQRAGGQRRRRTAGAAYLRALGAAADRRVRRGGRAGAPGSHS